ncbi:MAG: hypothetical protein DRQ24_08570 [Candidatus Latescibacterota bacterium]|nr:MAG: hypothetical protein DRQ24_08570 [Candidatus Latescibacterota bacterium]
MCAVKKKTQEVKASCYLVNKNYKGAVDEFSIIWGIIENLENNKTAVKFIVEIEDKRIVIWISDPVSIETMLQMLEDILRMQSEKELEAMSQGLERDANEILREFRKSDARRQTYEGTVKRMCKSWGLSEEQTRKVIALSVVIAKMIEDMFKQRQAIPYIY